VSAPLSVKLRYYQKDAVDAYEKYLKENAKGNGVIDLPTASGKSYTLSEMIRRFTGDLDARILVTTHSKKLVKQDYNSTCKLWPEGKHLFGINSAGLKRRDYKKKVIFCGIQSVFDKAKEICIEKDEEGEDIVRKVNFLIIDEAHRCNVKDSVQYKKFIKELLKINPDMRVCGLSATPFRMGQGLIYGPSSDLLFDDLVYKANTKELMAQGYLAKPITPGINKENRIDTKGVKEENGDFKDSDLDSRVNIPSLIKSQVNETIRECKGLNSIAWFAVNIDHAENIAAELRSRGESVAVVHSKIEEDDEKLLQKFEKGELRFLVSVNMFVEGFDAPNIQAIVDTKPTLSPGRYVQMYGRGFRLCLEIGKKTFLVLDFAGNVGRHGPVDQVEPEAVGEKDSEKTPKKQCEKCGMMCHARYKACPYCGWLFPPPLVNDPEDRTFATAANNSVISEPKWFKVKRLECLPAKNKPAISAQYFCEGGKFRKDIIYDELGREWLKNHLGEQIPFDIKNFFGGGYRSKLKIPKKIFVDEAGVSSKILKYEF
jgi:DNA repair protein RadD